MKAAIASSPLPVTAVAPADIHSAPVLTDFAEASAPKSALAQRLAAEARAQLAKLGTKGDNKAGKLRTLSVGRADYFMLMPHQIQSKAGRNSRLMNDPANLQYIDELARSIAEEGVKTPVTVSLEGDTPYLTDGHCRLLATFRAIEVYGAEIRAIPAIAEPQGLKESDFVLRQVLNGKPLTPLELGAAYIKMRKLGWSTQDIATKIGQSRMRIEQVLVMMDGVTPAIEEMVTSGRIAASTAARALHEAKSDPLRAEQTLKAALQTAERAGKTRATPKHLLKTTGSTGKSTAFKPMLRTILTAPTTTIVVDESVATITMSADDWKLVSAGLGRLRK